jgi:hypothetical protein
VTIFGIRNDFKHLRFGTIAAMKHFANTLHWIHHAA